MIQAVDREPLEVDLTQSTLYADGFPHEVFASLRQEAPVMWQAFPEGFPGNHDDGFWVLSKHEDVQTVSRSPNSSAPLTGLNLATSPRSPGRCSSVWTDQTTSG